MKSNQKSSHGRIGNIYQSPAIGKLTIKSLQLVASDIATWRMAVDTARSATNPRRHLLYDLYSNIELDAHLDTVRNKRTISITNKKLMWLDDKGEVNQDERIKKEILTAPWFYSLLRHTMDALSWGHSLIELIVDNGKVVRVDLINRFNVMPDYAFVSYQYNTHQPTPGAGIFYREDPSHNDYLIEVCSPDNYGLFMKAAPYVLYKRNGIGDWAQFAELFGMPFRIGKYNPFDERTRSLLEQGMDKMGGAGFAIIPDGTALEFHDNNGTGKSEVFKDLAEMMNEELSKLYLGGTMTVEDGASRSQGQVHADGEDDINISDMLWVEHLLNHVLKPRLRKLTGMAILDKGSFQFPETGQISLKDRINIDMQLSQRIPFPVEYWYKTYNIDMPEGAMVLPVANNPYKLPQSPEKDPNKKDDEPDGPDNDLDKQDKNPGNQDKLPEKPNKKGDKPLESSQAALRSLYANAKAHFTPITITAAEGKKRDKIWNRIAKGIHNGEITPDKVDPELHAWVSDQLMKGVTTGFGKDIDFTSDDPDAEMLSKLQRDVQVFSGFKCHQELRLATDLVTNEDGMVRPFSEFKRLIKEIDNAYNVVYLAAEYQQAVASSQMASKWMDIKRDSAELPLLQYTTAGDDRVRPDHAKLDAIIKPVDDPFWDTYYPPNDWGCRCDVDQVIDGEVTPTTDDDLPLVKDMFKINVGKDGVVFPPKHPYYDVKKEYEEAAKDNFGLQID